MEPTQNRLCRRDARKKLFDKSKNILTIIWANFKKGKLLPLKSTFLQECCWMPWKQLQQCKNIYWGSNSCFFRSKTRNLFLYLYQEFYWRVPFNKRSDAPRYHLKMSEDAFDTVSKVSLTRTPNASLKCVPIKITLLLLPRTAH